MWHPSTGSRFFNCASANCTLSGLALLGNLHVARTYLLMRPLALPVSDALQVAPASALLPGAALSGPRHGVYVQWPRNTLGTYHTVPQRTRGPAICGVFCAFSGKRSPLRPLVRVDIAAVNAG
eukprot:1195085-Amphidinium_carterae.1